MSCCDHSLKVHVGAIRYDPTRTTTIRKQFESEIARRFRGLKRSATDLLLKEDAFGIKNNDRRFAFLRDPDKVTAFMDWLKEQQRAGILDVTPGVPMARAAETSWMAVYLQAAYQRGMAQSAANLRGAGVSVADDWVMDAFTRPFHADRVGLAFTRAYQDLEGINAEMDKQISRIVADGLSQGQAPSVMATAINDRIQHVGITRARMLARTEVIRAHAEASLNTYEEAGLLGVGVQAEWRTAEDSSVCQECESAAQDGPYTIEEARGMIPLHPNCRCAWVPIVDNPDTARLR